MTARFNAAMLLIVRAVSQGNKHNELKTASQLRRQRQLAALGKTNYGTALAGRAQLRAGDTSAGGPRTGGPRTVLGPPTAAATVAPVIAAAGIASIAVAPVIAAAGIATANLCYLQKKGLS
jgi:hypothetical protein